MSTHVKVPIVIYVNGAPKRVGDVTAVVTEDGNVAIAGAIHDERISALLTEPDLVNFSIDLVAAQPKDVIQIVTGSGGSGGKANG